MVGNGEFCLSVEFKMFVWYLSVNINGVFGNESGVWEAVWV